MAFTIFLILVILFGIIMTLKTIFGWKFTKHKKILKLGNDFNFSLPKPSKEFRDLVSKEKAFIGKTKLRKPLSLEEEMILDNL